MNTRIKQLLREEGGFTLPEMLVTILLMLVVMSALYSIFNMSLRVFSFGNDKVEAVENARLGLEKMEREIRAAYPYNKAGIGGPVNNTVIAGGVANPSTSISFGNDTNGDHKITTPNEEITYRLSGSAPYSLLRANPSNETSPDPVVESVKANGLTFRYLDKNGNPVTIDSEISRVRIKLEIEIDRRNLGKRTQTLTTDVDLRNRE